VEKDFPGNHALELSKQASSDPRLWCQAIRVTDHGSEFDLDYLVGPERNESREDKGW
jgi:hypothetical protein